MKLLKLSDNALFLQNWRERLRPSFLISAVVLCVIVIILIITNASVQESYIYDYSHRLSSDTLNYPNRILTPPLKIIILNLAKLQGSILLLLGTFNAYRMASREYLSGTLDFHRASPTPRIDQILGLLFGSTSLEWCLYFAISFLILSISVFAQVPVLSLIQFTISVTLTGLFYHSIAVLLGMTANPKASKTGIIQIFLVLYFMSSFMIANGLSFSYHLSWLPAYEQLSDTIKGIVYEYYYENSYAKTMDTLRYSFFGYQISSLGFQIFCQIPLILIVLSGVGRKISSQERPVLSKRVSLAAIFFILFMYFGSACSHILYGDYSGTYIITSGIWLIIITGVIGAMIATPSHLSFVRGLRRCQKFGKTSFDPSGDESGHSVWLILYCLLATFIYWLYLDLFQIQLLKSLPGLLILLSYPVFFAALYEYCKLTTHRHKKVFFITTLLILWILVPAFGLMIKGISAASSFAEFLIAFSPVMGGLTPVINIYSSYPQLSFREVELFVSNFMALIALLMAHRQRRRIVEQVKKEYTKK